MKKVVAILLAAITLFAVFCVPASARGYTLSIPKTVSSHNLEAYGVHTMNVFETEVPPTIDGEIGVGEYPGPNNGCALSSVPGDGLWMSAYYLKTTTDDQNGFYGRFDFNDYVLEQDKPDYINSYLTYDDQFLYFGVTATIPAIRFTTATDTEVVYGGVARREPYWWLDTFVNFMQTDNIAAAHYNSRAQTKYTLYKYDSYNTAYNVSFGARTLMLIDDVNVKHYISQSISGNYVDAETGITWNATTYKRAENFFYKVTVLENNKWFVTFEGRQPLGDVLRITDVEYEDGSPIDYVPEWGVWGAVLRLQSSGNISKTAPNGTEVQLYRDDVIYAQTMLPAYGAARTGTNSVLNGYLFHNTVSNAVAATHGQAVNYLENPVHYLGKYDETFSYGATYSQVAGTVLASTTTRLTRTRAAVLTSGVRGVNYRVIGVATSAASATGDNVTWTVILSVVMLLCAAAVVVIVFMKKRSSRT